MEAIILAGGLGSRLKSVVNDRPKVMALISGKPFLNYIIEYLIENGVTSFVFSLGYLSDHITDFISELQLDISVKYSIETVQLGTGGAIKQALDFITTDNVIVVNADTYFNVDLKNMMKQHLWYNADCTVSLKKLKNFNRYGTVEINDEGKVISFIEKKQTEEGLISGGYLILNKKKFLECTNTFPKIFSIETDFLQKMLKINVYSYLCNGFFIDIGIPEDYVFAQSNLTTIIKNKL
jgi:D-glycero-alpha-D-manno-heptose 1-phosphate guanylyltransferase